MLLLLPIKVRTLINKDNTRVVKLVYTRHLKCLGFGHEGSNPSLGTKEFEGETDEYNVRTSIYIKQHNTNINSNYSSNFNRSN